MVGNPRKHRVSGACASTGGDDVQTRPKVGLEVSNQSRHETGVIPTVTPARVAKSGRAVPPPFPQGAGQRNKGEHERPHPPIGRARQGSDDGTYTQIPEALFSLVGRIVPPNIPQIEVSIDRLRRN